MKATTETKKAFGAGFSTDPDWRKAASAAVREANDGLRVSSCDLALVFVSQFYGDLEPGELAGQLRSGLKAGALLGCNASGAIGSRREVEMESAVSVLAMSLPGAKVRTFTLDAAEVEGMKDGAALVSALDVYPNENPSFLCLADPMTCDIEALVGRFNEGYPGRPLMGGLASGQAVGAANWLIEGEAAVSRGAVIAALTGDVAIESVVSQGCRPIGSPHLITRAEGHVVSQLGGRPAFDVLRETVEALSKEDQKLARHSLFAGVVINERQARFKRGDFLVRNLMGVDGKTGALAIGAHLRAGQTVQFQLRDAATSDEDLRSLLEALPAGGASPRGALVFSCCGRGRGLYGSPDHDIGLIQSLRGPLPAAGFFANGELGPVGARNFVHGYTSSLAVIT